MKCPFREGSKGCSWWVTGCMHPAVAPEVKAECGKAPERLQK